MFDLRYHVASLAAVFLALAVGILLGIGVADRGLIDRGREGLLREENADLRGEIEAANLRVAAAEEREIAASAFVEEAYPTIVQNRLLGTRVALVFVGSVDDSV